MLEPWKWTADLDSLKHHMTIVGRLHLVNSKLDSERPKWQA